MWVFLLACGSPFQSTDKEKAAPSEKARAACSDISQPGVEKLIGPTLGLQLPPGVMKEKACKKLCRACTPAEGVELGQRGWDSHARAWYLEQACCLRCRLDCIAPAMVADRQWPGRFLFFEVMAVSQTPMVLYWGVPAWKL